MQALNIIEQGGVILYPTDTVWGLGCDAANPQAVKRIYEIKQRADSKALILLVDSLTTLKRVVGEINETAKELIANQERPTTVIYPQINEKYACVAAQDGSVAVRVTSERFSWELCMLLNGPLVSTSANISGQPSPLSFDEISDEIRNSVDYVVKYGRETPTNSPQPSKIVRLNNDNTIEIIRP
ncbi:MAG: threonylcarbamoyl-AMP synthase [Muribaculaceae bacterium]|nr:threonylcarbamoyl-AMP synthase [Muribaculaceae bacterium]